ncbi:MAG TPA: hypothetical protein EYP59_04240, partial [Thiotrichaceae bacterium]|nr:hypothetical protein [Thiotrichaceae bacterium]
MARGVAAGAAVGAVGGPVAPITIAIAAGVGAIVGFTIGVTVVVLSGDEHEMTFEIDATGKFKFHVKPMYPVSDAFTVYALLGYAGADITIDRADFEYTTDSVDGFSWGIGAEYKFSDAVGLFVDYVSVYDD